MSEWMQWVVLAIVALTFAWAVGVVMKFNRLQHEMEREKESEKRALKSLLVKLYREAKERGDLGAARAVQIQGYTYGVDVDKEASWSRAS